MECMTNLSFGRDYFTPIIAALIMLILVMSVFVVRKSRILKLFLLGEYKDR